MTASWRTYPLVALLLRRRPEFTRDFVIFVVVAALGNAFVLAIVNSAAARAQEAATVGGWYLALFVIAVVTFLYAQYVVGAAATREAERVMDGVRADIARHIARAELQSLERVGAPQIFGCVNRDTVIVTQAASALPAASQALLMMVFSSIYLYYLSPIACGLTIALGAIGLRVSVAKRDEWGARLEAAGATHNAYVASLTHLLAGFKEVRVNSERSRDLLKEMHRISRELQTIKTESERSFVEQYAFGEGVYYLLVGGVIFILPQVSATFPAVVMQSASAVMFIAGPLATLVGAIPVLARANAAAQSVMDVERALENVESNESRAIVDRPVLTDAPIALRHLEFKYEAPPGEEGFAIGPISLDIAPGRILFIVGGNGSGKSTFLKVLTGLYRAQHGSAQMGPVLVTGETAQWYRSHFTVVFADCHLFDRLYGLSHVPLARVNQELARMQLQDKVSVDDKGRFSTLELSSGQRKRLALAVALMEDRPVLVVDEWAAEQDPDFRRKFYREILPELRSQGRTIIAATHDDRYFDVADEVVKLELGRIVDGPATPKND
jgi:putative ATP-binding cassette transporter